MVLERLFPKERMLNSFWFSFLVSGICAIAGIFIARLLFGANSGIASVMFTTILLIPVLKDLFVDQEINEESLKKFKIISLFKENKTIIKTYMGIFIGIFATYYIISFIGVLLRFNVVSILREQLLLDAGLIGMAPGQSNLLVSILNNNWLVLIACFLLSIVAGSGGSLFVIWNASSWAAIFGYRAAASAFVLNTNPIVTASVIEIFTLPHTLIEGLAYVVASIAGIVISAYVVRKSKKKGIFFLSFLAILGCLWFLNFFLSRFIQGLVLTILMMTVFVLLFGLLGKLFQDEKHKLVYKYNHYLLIGALGLFIIGALVESFVLSGATILNDYYSAAYIYATLI